jgi:hypothetical protein
MLIIHRLRPSAPRPSALSLRKDTCCRVETQPLECQTAALKIHWLAPLRQHLTVFCFLLSVPPPDAICKKEKKRKRERKPSHRIASHPSPSSSAPSSPVSASPLYYSISPELRASRRIVTMSQIRGTAGYNLSNQHSFGGPSTDMSNDPSPLDAIREQTSKIEDFLDTLSEPIKPYVPPAPFARTCVALGGLLEQDTSRRPYSC